MDKSNEKLNLDSEQELSENPPNIRPIEHSEEEEEYDINIQDNEEHLETEYLVDDGTNNEPNNENYQPESGPLIEEYDINEINPELVPFTDEYDVVEPSGDEDDDYNFDAEPLIEEFNFNGSVGDLSDFSQEEPPLLDEYNLSEPDDDEKYPQLDYIPEELKNYIMLPGPDYEEYTGEVEYISSPKEHPSFNEESLLNLGISVSDFGLDEVLTDLPFSPPRKKSDDVFVEEYMEHVPDTPTPQRRLSKEALELEQIQDEPSPPATPKKTLRRMNQCPSVESFLKIGEPVRLYFVVLPGQKIFCIDARMDRTISDIKKEISPICKVPAEYLDLRRNRNLVMDYKTLRELGAKPRKKMRFTVEVSKRCPDEDLVLKIPEENLIKQHAPVVRNVRVRNEDKSWKTVKVHVEFPSEPKEFIGGYRDKKKNIYYHNALTQTPKEPKEYSEDVSHFSCQTFNDTWKKVQTSVTTYQQTMRLDYYISALNQKVIHPKVYITAEEVEQTRIKAAIVIQKYWRRWLAIRERAARLEGLIKRIEWAENIRKGRTEIRLAIKEDEMYRQNHPTRMIDVELLYRAINEWRRKEVEYINQHRWGADRKAALAEIMEKEADLLLDLERTKTTIRKNMHDGYVEKIFRKMGDPTRWLNRSGNFIAMDNKEKSDMRNHHKLYNLLREPVTELEKRIEALNKLQDITKTYSSRISKYLSSLIDREFDLLKFNAGPRLMEGLRQRLLNTFCQLLRDPNFNPEAKKLQKVPFDTQKLRKDMVQCKGCRKMQFREYFTVTRGVNVTTRCQECTNLYRTCILRSDLNLYRRMLAEIRHDEQMAGVETSVTYLIDAYDLQFLIEQLWQCQSALSGIDDRYLLRLCRWKRDEPWTPWNCVLLTEEESVAHLHLDDMEAAYQPAFLQKVLIKHQGAKIYFARLSVLSIPLDRNLKEKCDDVKKNEKIKMLKARQQVADLG